MEAWKLAANQVDLWHIDVSGLLEVGGFRRLLSPDEIERANRFHFEKHQRCFTLMRAARILAVQVDPGEVTRWSMYDIETPPGYKAALVVEGSHHRLRHLRWAPQTNADRSLEQ